MLFEGGIGVVVEEYVPKWTGVQKKGSLSPGKEIRRYGSRVQIQ